MAITRRALLIDNPGEVGDEHYCKGTFVDIANYKRFLDVAHGGWWFNSEIVHLHRPSAQEVREQVAALQGFDYSFIAYAGHGYYSSIDRATVLKLRKDVELSSVELCRGATKRTVVLDCCREIYNKSAMLQLSGRSMEFSRAESSYKRIPNGTLCRQKFSDEISTASNALIVINSCSPGEVAGDDERTGGYYTFNFIGCADLWAEEQSKSYYSTSATALSVVASHNVAAPKTTSDSRERPEKNKIQNPTIEKPRTNANFFPFGVFA